jgi:HPt (histidine-containing phosphotransfer) domain-containing protein
VNADQTHPIFSSFADDADMVELIDLFVDEMPARVETLQNALRDRHWDRLRTLTHQLKGAAPGYGFEAIGRAAGEVERVVAHHADGEAVARALDELLAVCLRAARTDAVDRG